MPFHIAPAVLAAIPFVILVTKYLSQITKDVVIPTGAPQRASLVRLYVIALAAAQILATAISAKDVTQANLNNLPVDLLVGVACGLAAIGDFHLLDFLRTDTTPTAPAPTS